MRRDEYRGNANYERDWQEREYERGRGGENRGNMSERDDYGYMGRYDWGSPGYHGNRDFERRYGDQDAGRRDWERGGHQQGYGDRGGYGGGSMGTYAPDRGRQQGWGYDQGRQGQTGGQQGWMGGGNWGGEQLSDEEIRRRVYNSIDNNPRIPDTADIHVEVNDCEVTLTGTVRNREAKMAAWDCAWNVPSVEDVHNNVRVESRYRQGMRNQNQMGQTNQGNQAGQTGQQGQSGMGQNNQQSATGASRSRGATR